ncbi:MAG: GTPase Era [Acidobacteria bacterium]|nr:GTPase Era [Acidobacteriota bacterium]
MSEAPFRAGFAAIIGRANVGKSTLLNRLVGGKVSIVSPVPQTTRHRVVGVCTLPQAQVAFIDSPGFHRPQHQLGELLLERARQVAGEADLVLVVIDAASGVGPGDEFVLQMLDPGREKRPCILVPNKIDTMNKGKLLPLIERAVADWKFHAVVPVSALTGENCDELMKTVLEVLPEGPPLFPPEFVSDQPERKIVAEIVREKLLERLRQEVPHAVAVLIERMERREDGLVEIDALIVVERPSQKGIVIGAKGHMLKEVGTAARRELEERLGGQVFLKLWVKVREHWRDRDAILRELDLFSS